MTVDDVMFTTRLPRSVIVALESENFAVFASPTYAKSFLSQYSVFLSVEAGPWLAALRPASFMSAETVRPLLKEANPRKIPGPSERGNAGGWISSVWLLGISGGLVFGALEGYRFFDRMDGQTSNQDPQPPISGEKTMGEFAPVAKKAEAEFSSPPPRAIIVR